MTARLVLLPIRLKIDAVCGSGGARPLTKAVLPPLAQALLAPVVFSSMSQLKRAGFQLVDRLLNLWLLVRTSPIFRQRLHRLVAFLQWMHRPTASSSIGLETARQLCLEGRPQEAIAIARSQLMGVDLQAIEWREPHSFFSAFVQAGLAHEGVALLDDCGLSAHVEPLREALAMIAADTTGAVFAVAKEIHRIAEQLRVSLRGAAGRASRTER